MPAIGVLGGMGPHAGLDLCRKIFDETDATRDQDHVSVAMLSYSDRIPDRAPFLLDQGGESPVDALVAIALSLEAAGASVIGMPCNTAHAPRIFDAMCEQVKGRGSSINFLHIVDETIAHIREVHPEIQTVGVLSTTATRNLRLYAERLETSGLNAVSPDDEVQEEIVNRSIYDPPHGIKAQANPISEIARQSLQTAISHLRDRGAEAVILGCTELPLVVTESRIEETVIIDPTRVLARALLRETHPERMKPLRVNGRETV
jgi:aspartate racemase